MSMRLVPVWKKTWRHINYNVFFFNMGGMYSCTRTDIGNEFQIVRKVSLCGVEYTFFAWLIYASFRFFLVFSIIVSYFLILLWQNVDYYVLFPRFNGISVSLKCGFNGCTGTISDFKIISGKCCCCCWYFLKNKWIKRAK